MSPFESNILRLKHMTMLRQREILELLNQRLSQRAIGSTIHCCRRDVSAISKAAQEFGKSYGELLSLSDKELLRECRGMLKFYNRLIDNVLRILYLSM